MRKNRRRKNKNTPDHVEGARNRKKIRKEKENEEGGKNE